MEILEKITQAVFLVFVIFMCVGVMVISITYVTHAFI